MENLQKLSGRLKMTFKILTFAVPILICMLWILIDWQPVKALAQLSMISQPVITPEGVVDLAKIELNFTAKMMALFAHLLGSSPYILAYIALHKLFNNYSQGRIFTPANTQIYKKIGWLAFLNGIFFIPITETFMVLAATLSNPPGHRYITLGFGTPSLEAILCGLLVIVIALVMQEAQALQDENQLTV